MKRAVIFLTVVLIIFASISFGQQTGSFTDTRDNKTYKIVKIGSQWWMAENLSYKPFSGNSWIYDNYDNNLKIYGRLYDWETANRVCPTGWHLPSVEELLKLTEILLGKKVAGGKMKATILWDSPNTGATNESGFFALPSGYRGAGGKFFYIGNYCGFWSSTQSDETDAFYIGLDSDHVETALVGSNKALSFSVRCLRD